MNIHVLRKGERLRVKGHNVYSLLSNASEKNIATPREREREKEKANVAKR